MELFRISNPLLFQKTSEPLGRGHQRSHYFTQKFSIQLRKAFRTYFNNGKVNLHLQILHMNQRFPNFEQPILEILLNLTDFTAKVVDHCFDIYWLNYGIISFKSSLMIQIWKTVLRKIKKINDCQSESSLIEFWNSFLEHQNIYIQNVQCYQSCSGTYFNFCCCIIKIKMNQSHRAKGQERPHSRTKIFKESPRSLSPKHKTIFTQNDSIETPRSMKRELFPAVKPIQDEDSPIEDDTDKYVNQEEILERIRQLLKSIHVKYSLVGLNQEGNQLLNQQNKQLKQENKELKQKLRQENTQQLQRENSVLRKKITETTLLLEGLSHTVQSGQLTTAIRVLKR